MGRASLFVMSCVLASTVAGLPAVALPAPEGPDRPAVFSQSATQSVLLGIARAGNRLVAVGERGIILLSDDFGGNWRQVPAPVSVTLTAVQFISDKVGWAVGHAGVVLSTEDGGQSWTRRLDGMTAAKLALDAAQADAAARPADAVAQRGLADAQRLVDDGADKPFFALHFDDAEQGFVIGAYNLIFHTSDGGKSWQPWLSHLDNPKALHLYAIERSGDALFIAGEQGLVLRSIDRGEHFTPVKTPYTGSYFAMAALPNGGLVIAGLRGHAYRSTGDGGNWEKIEFPAPVSFNAISVDGQTVLLTNQAGQLFASRDAGLTWQPKPLPSPVPVTAMLPLPNGGLVGVGLRGVWHAAPSSEK